MKRINLFLKILTLCFVVTLSFYSLNSPKTARAYSPIIAVCSNGVLDDLSIDTSRNSVEQLFEVRLDQYYLDAAAVRLKSIDEPSTATVTVTKRDGPVIASGTQIVPMTESWIYVDFNNVAIPRGVYLLKVTSGVNDPIIWKYTPHGDCIEDSHLILNGDMNLDIDMGFAIYAYDNSQSDSDRTAPSGTSDQLVGESSTDTSSQDNDSTSDTSTNNPSSVSNNNSSQQANEKDLTNLTNSLKKDNSGSPWETIIPLFLLLLVIAAPVIFIIWMVIINRKKKEPQKDKGSGTK